MTRETVPRETPAAAATSRTVGRFLAGAGIFFSTVQLYSMSGGWRWCDGLSLLIADDHAPLWCRYRRVQG
jgi:hypothetical protein